MNASPLFRSCSDQKTLSAQYMPELEKETDWQRHAQKAPVRCGSHMPSAKPPALSSSPHQQGTQAEALIGPRGTCL
jgi:hypothetical protein